MSKQTTSDKTTSDLKEDSTNRDDVDTMDKQLNTSLAERLRSTTNTKIKDKTTENPENQTERDKDNTSDHETTKELATSTRPKAIASPSHEKSKPLRLGYYASYGPRKGQYISPDDDTTRNIPSSQNKSHNPTAGTVAGRSVNVYRSNNSDRHGSPDYVERSKGYGTHSNKGTGLSIHDSSEDYEENQTENIRKNKKQVLMSEPESDQDSGRRRKKKHRNDSEDSELEKEQNKKRKQKLLSKKKKRKTGHDHDLDSESNSDDSDLDIKEKRRKGKKEMKKTKRDDSDSSDFHYPQDTRKTRKSKKQKRTTKRKRDYDDDSECDSSAEEIKEQSKKLKAIKKSRKRKREENDDDSDVEQLRKKSKNTSSHKVVKKERKKKKGKEDKKAGSPKKRTPKKSPKKLPTTSPKKSPKKSMKSPKKSQMKSPNKTREKSLKKTPKKKRSKHDNNDTSTDCTIAELHTYKEEEVLKKMVTGYIADITEDCKLSKEAPKVRRRLVLVDNTSMIIANVHKHPFTFRRGDTVSVTNGRIIQGRILIHTATVVQLAKPISLRKQTIERARLYLKTPINDYSDLKTLKNLNLEDQDDCNDYYSAKGLVVEVNDKTVAKLERGPALTREIRIAEDDTVMIVSLWGTAVHKDIKRGQLLYCQDAKVLHSTYHNEKVLRNGYLDCIFHSFGESGMDSMASFTSGRLQQTNVMDDEDITTTNVGLLLEEDPGLAASAGLFDSFLSLMRTHPSEHQVFELLDSYSSVCHEQVATLRKLTKRATPGQIKYAKVEEMLKMLDKEKQTWKLITLLFKDRLEASSTPLDDEPMMVDKLGQHQSEKQLVSTLYERDSSVRQAQLVVDWLEQAAQEELEEFYDKYRVFTDQTGSWENTLHVLKQKKGGISYSSERQMVSEMDPDAPIRQRRPLADLDEDDELYLTRHLFACIRAGNLDKAQELCMQCGQEWRAATLEGWRLYHDQNYDGYGSQGEVLPVEGNPYRDIWKAVCWKMADEERYNIHERALYATLSGNLRRLLPACSSWADYVWAYFKVLVDTRVEQEIRINNTGDHRLEELPSSYWDKVMSAESIFKEIQASPNEQVGIESRQRFHTLQKYLILGDIDALIEEIYEWVKDDNVRLPRHLLRFTTHLILFLRSVGLSSKEELCVAIMEAYVGDLIENHQVALVAHYVAVLPQTLQVEWYAKFLEGVSVLEERRLCLELASEAGLDVQSVTKLVVENIRDKADFSLEADAPLDTNITDDDRQKINAVDWLVFDPAQRSEAIRQANALMRNFLASRKLTAGREVFSKIPPGSIDVVVKTWQMQTGSTELCDEDDNTIREYLCIQAYLTAHDSFNDWFEHYHHAKPKKPAALTTTNFTERIAHEHKEKQYAADLERWKHTLQLQSKTTVDQMYNVLLFVDGGWMVDQRKDAAVDDCRTHQMTLLRQLCLPALCYLLHTVLHTTGRYQECMQLADTIASEQYQLYKVFQRSDLQKFLQKLMESCIPLLDKGSDPLGYRV